LNNLTDTNYPKDLIKKELQNYLNKINSNSLKLAKAYKDFGNHKIKQTGLTFEEILQSPKYNSHVFEAPFFIQERLEVLTDISSGINSTNRINYYKKNKSENSYKFLDDNRNLLDEIDNFLNDFKIFLQFYIVFSCKSYGNMDNNSISFYVKYNLDEIKYLAFNDKKDKDTYDYLLSLINFNVEILPDGLLGSKSMSRSLFYQYASRQLINISITHLTNIGYDLSDLTTPQKHNSITTTK
ncbi:MAG: hypothetical protein IJ295_03830, partial [Clostridia bacterium]|nr:hypothetical protein [Clostridia bacterium]